MIVEILVSKSTAPTLLTFLRADLSLRTLDVLGLVADVRFAPHKPVNSVCQLVQRNEDWDLHDVEDGALDRRPLV